MGPPEVARVGRPSRATRRESEVRGRSLLTRTARIGRDSTEASTYKFRYLTSSKDFGAWSSTPGVPLTVAQSPTKVRSGTSSELDLYELRADVREREVGKAFDLELAMETEDAFLKRADWWVGMRIADAIDDCVSIRVLFPSGLSYKTIASLKYVNETPIEKKTTDGVLVENEMPDGRRVVDRRSRANLHVSNPMGLEKVSEVCRAVDTFYLPPARQPMFNRCGAIQVD